MENKLVKTEDIAKMKRQGYTQPEIANYFNVTISLVVHRLRKVNLLNNGKTHNTLLKRRVKECLVDILKDYFDNKLSLEKISTKYKIPRSSISIVFREQKIQLRSNNDTRKYLRELGLYKPADLKGSKNPNWRGGRPRMEYHGYFLEDYFAFRKEVMKRDEYICKICGDNYNLKVHHIIPTRIAKDRVLDITNAICLCDECHKKTYMKEDKFESYFFSLIENTAKAGVSIE